MTQTEEDELINIQDSSKMMQLSSFFDANKAVNEDSLKLK